MAANIVNATDTSFDADVIKSDVPVLVDFWATWCVPCKAIAPTLEAIANDQAGKVKVVKVDIDNNPSIAMKYGVRSIPTVLMFKGGQVVGQQVGAANRRTYDALVAKAF